MHRKPGGRRSRLSQECTMPVRASRGRRNFRTGKSVLGRARETIRAARSVPVRENILLVEDLVFLEDEDLICKDGCTLWPKHALGGCYALTYKLPEYVCLLSGRSRVDQFSAQVRFLVPHCFRGAMVR